MVINHPKLIRTRLNFPSAVNFQKHYTSKGNAAINVCADHQQSPFSPETPNRRKNQRITQSIFTRMNPQQLLSPRRKNMPSLLRKLLSLTRLIARQTISSLSLVSGSILGGKFASDGFSKREETSGSERGSTYKLCIGHSSPLHTYKSGKIRILLRRRRSPAELSSAVLFRNDEGQAAQNRKLEELRRELSLRRRRRRRNV